MSRLDSAIRRLCAQRDCLEAGLEIVSGQAGDLLEFGLGNGRTFDHLRRRGGTRSIHVFDRQVAAHPDCVPDPKQLFLGEFEDTLPDAVRLLGRSAILAHLDVGNGVDAASRDCARLVARFLPDLMLPGAVVVSDQPVGDGAWEQLPLPASVAAGRYFMYRLPEATASR